MCKIHWNFSVSGCMPCSTQTGLILVHLWCIFTLKCGKKVDKNELTKERQVKWWNKAKNDWIRTVPINAALETFENWEEKPFPILRYDGRLTVALLQFSSPCSSCSSSSCIDKMDCQFYLFQNELFAGHTHNRPIDENNFLYFQSFIEKATFILILINLKYLFQ